MKSVTGVLCGLILFMSSLCQGQSRPVKIWATGEYTLYADSIVQQNKLIARALSPARLVSRYSSPANAFKSPEITFKFCINGGDNEMLSGKDHHFNYVSKSGYAETPLITFGKQFKDTTTIPENFFLPSNAKWKIRLDMRQVLQSFKDTGYYTNFKGEKIYKQDFNSVYVAGSPSPLTWVFDNLAGFPELQLKDDDGDGIYEAVILLNPNDRGQNTAGSWTLSKDITAFPQYKSDYLLTDALYNMALEEMQNAIEPDSTFRTGKEWAGVWTRDISYSIILSMAYLQPAVAKKSLLKKVNGKGRIIQDTGTGGAWPVSSDRLIWAVAAWELYKSTGDKDWLQQAYLIVKNSIEDDLNTIYDAETGLVKGESSFLDWREQTYPKWMQPADIFESENLGTSAVHYEANLVLAEMAGLLHDHKTAVKHTAIAAKIRTGINRWLWMPGKGYYGGYIYGRGYKLLSPRSEALGEALSVLFNIADSGRQKRVVASTPVTSFGIPCIYPQIPGIPPYHNNAVWPFVQTFWLWAAAKTGNERSVMESISDIYRPAALFLTNKENFVADNGDFLGTQINSSNMLWSLSGNLSIIHKVLFGMEFQKDRLLFHPFVPAALRGKRSLTNFKYRKSELTIVMEGYGNQIKSFSVDGKIVSEPSIRSNSTGRHTIKIVLADKPFIRASINKVANYISPSTPMVTLSDREMVWQPVKGAVSYRIFKNGRLYVETTENRLAIKDTAYVTCQVEATDVNKIGSFLSEPVSFTGQGSVAVYEAEAYMDKGVSYACKGFTGNGYAEISTNKNELVTIPVDITRPGKYVIDFRYSNGNGPVNTENKCAIRTIKMDGRQVGAVVFPQRGKEEWSNWGYSNGVTVFLNKGKHVLTLSLERYNENMNGIINQAMLDYMRLTKIE